jgi:cinnamyl-alcohol dehydrogenase
MLDFCGRHNITAKVEVIPASYVNKAMTRLVSNDVHFRFVIDIANSLSASSPEVEDA